MTLLAEGIAIRTTGIARRKWSCSSTTAGLDHRWSA